MRVTLADQTLELSRSDFVGAGGEGQVYVQEGRAYKIYHAPQRALRRDKLEALRALPSPPFITPIDLVHDAQGAPVGYAMEALPPRALALTQLCSRAAWRRHGLEMAQALHLLSQLRGAVAAAHARGVLIVDLNGVNVRVREGLDEILLIDTDSYQTPEHPATAQMEAIRDPLAVDGFSEGSDWFAFAVLAFQLLTGLHPYKGKHPEIRGLAARMRAGISALNPAVRRPPSCAPLEDLPRRWRAWLEAVLEEGQRVPPPLEASDASIPRPIHLTKPMAQAKALQIEPIFEGAAPIQALWSDGERLVTRTPEGLRVDQGPVTPVDAVELEVGFLPRTGDPVALGLHASGQVTLERLSDGRRLPNTLRGDQVMSHEGRLYLKNRGQIGEIVWVGAAPTVGFHPVAQVLPRATRLLPGLAAQNLLGAAYLTLFPGPKRALQVRVAELDGYEILDGRFEGGVALLLGAKEGQIDRLWMRFDVSTGHYDLTIEPRVVYTEVNFTALPTGIAVALDGEARLRLSSARVGVEGERRLEDPALDGAMTLARRGATPLLIRDGGVYTVAMA